MNHVLDNYLNLRDRHDVDLCILWANHTEVPENIGQFDSMLEYWVGVVFNSDGYFKQDGRPVVIIFSPDRLEKNARGFGFSAKQLLARARGRAVAAGYKGIYFIAASQGVGEGKLSEIALDGYDAISAYNYHSGYSGGRPSRASHSYKELDEGYRETWRWIVDNSPIPFVVPVTSGWDSRPWGGSSDPLHDGSNSDVAAFRQHLLAAREFIDSNQSKVLPAVFVCCWNEFGEGSYIEPTKEKGFQYIDAISEVFREKR